MQVGAEANSRTIYMLGWVFIAPAYNRRQVCDKCLSLHFHVLLQRTRTNCDC